MLEELISSLPEGVVTVNPDQMEAYRRDRANDPNAGMPLAVVRARSAEHVQTAVRWAAKHDVPVIPRGAGSGLSGGSTAQDGAIVISLDKMRDITIDVATRTAVVQPGAYNGEVNAAAQAEGLWYPPDPASREFCSIGGNISTNAGGLCCVKYGVTTDYVLGLKVVLADGKLITLGGPRVKDVAGFSLTKLFIGSEGALGIVVEITLRLVPQQRTPSTLVAIFPSLECSSKAVLDITRSMQPSMLEFMDNPTINAVEDDLRMGLDRTAAAMLIIQSDEPAEFAASEMQRMEDICNAAGATECLSTTDPDEGEQFAFARRHAIPAIEKTGSILLEDVGVPVPKLGDLVVGIAEIAERNGVRIPVMAHAGDGNTHPLVVFDPTVEGEEERANKAYGEVMSLAINLGGTITGEHGVGKLKQPWLKNYLGEDVYELNERIKKALDPQGILNPGTMVVVGPHAKPNA